MAEHLHGDLTQGPNEESGWTEWACLLPDLHRQAALTLVRHREPPRALGETAPPRGAVGSGEVCGGRGLPCGAGWQMSLGRNFGAGDSCVSHFICSPQFPHTGGRGGPWDHRPLHEGPLFPPLPHKPSLSCSGNTMAWPVSAGGVWALLSHWSLGISSKAERLWAKSTCFWYLPAPPLPWPGANSDFPKIQPKEP